MADVQLNNNLGVGVVRVAPTVAAASLPVYVVMYGIPPRRFILCLIASRAGRGKILLTVPRRQRCLAVYVQFAFVHTYIHRLGGIATQGLRLEVDVA